MSTKWSTTNLTYRFDHKNKEPFVQEEYNIRRILKEAFDVWERDSVLKFTEIKEGTADIMISFEHLNHTQIDPYVFGSQTLGHAFQPGKGLRGDIHFNERIKWDFNVKFDSKPEDGKISFYAVALHELGHSLGLGHSRDDEAVMYEFYSKGFNALFKNDRDGIQHIYGVPQNRKNLLKALPRFNAIPDKCNTPYDAIAIIDDEIVAFRGNYTFGPNMDVTNIHSRWHPSPNINHVDAVFQTSDKKVLFFTNQDVYVFYHGKQVRLCQLIDLGIDENVAKIDMIFKVSNQIYIFIENYFYKFDDRKLMIVGPSQEITSIFTDVFDMETAFTDRNDRTYLFKNQNYYELNSKTMLLNRMEPKFSSAYFMNCANSDTNVDDEERIKFLDMIDEGPEKEEEVEPNLAMRLEISRSAIILLISCLLWIFMINEYANFC